MSATPDAAESLAADSLQEQPPRDTPRFRLPVAEVVAETDEARSIVFAVPAELSEHFRYRPGQFLTVRIPVDGAAAVARCYSLSSVPDGGDQLTITVKRIADGVGSGWLCDHVVAGSELEVLPPAGAFVPADRDADFLLLAAGSGITPVMSILRWALSGGRGRVVLVYANRDERSVIFAAALRALAAEYRERLTVVHWLETLSGLPNDTALRGLLAPYAGFDAYVCGPTPFMDTAHATLRALDVPRSRIHIERFRSLTDDPFEAVVEAAPTDQDNTGGPAGVLEVELDGERHELAWAPGRRMLDVLVDQGLSAPFSCRQGLCGACTCRVVEGEVTMENNEVLEPDDLADGYVLACQSLAKTSKVRIDYV